jgi:enoyl-CoA hydratase
MTKYDHYECLNVQIADHIATVTLNRPELGNAVNETLHGEIGDIFYDLAIDDEVRAIVLTGAGEVFCSGGNPEDLVLAQPSDFNYDWMQKMRRLVLSLLDVDQPVVAALNGDAVGVGATIALYCDIIIAADGAAIYDPHVTKEGIAAGDGGFLMWALQLGMARAKYHLLTGAPLSAREAADAGLINECLPPDEVMPRAMALARQFADGPGLAIRATKRILNKVVEVLGAGTLEYAGEKERVTLFSADFKEAVTATVEGRKPSFQNR